MNSSSAFCIQAAHAQAEIDKVAAICVSGVVSSKDGPQSRLRPLNLTIFLRLLSHISKLGYPAHWLSHVVNSLLKGEITTIARAPRRLVLLQKDVDEAHPP